MLAAVLSMLSGDLAVLAAVLSMLSGDLAVLAEAFPIQAAAFISAGWCTLAGVLCAGLSVQVADFSTDLFNCFVFIPKYANLITCLLILESEFTLGLVEPNAEDRMDEESVAFFNLVGSSASDLPASYSALKKGNEG